jgi:hypothetical protein
MPLRLILATLTLGGLLLAAACGGDGDQTFDTGDGEVTLSEDLPDSFPDDFPIYPDAELEGAFTGEQEGIEGTVATWRTGDDFQDVVDFYEREFEEGPWTTTASGSATGSNFWSVENPGSDQVGYVAVSQGDEVSIIATVGDDSSIVTPDSGDDDGSGDDGSGDGDDGSGDGDSGDGDGGDPSADLPEEVDLSDDFPADVVSLPDGARVSGSTSVTSGGVSSHFVAFHSQDSADELADYFEAELTGNGYMQTIETRADGGVYAAYSENADGSGTTVIVTIAESTVAGYQEVGLTVSASE